MLGNCTVGVWNKGLATKVNGVTIPGVLEHIEDIFVDIQPYTTALLLLAYGYNIAVNKRIFVGYFDANIKIGTILRYVDGYGKTLNLEVKLVPWDDSYMEIMALGVIL